MQHQQAQAATAEVGEGRELAKGNSGQQTRVRTQGRAARSRALDRVRQVARDSARRLTARWHHVDASDRLREAYHCLKHDAAPGVDGQTWAAYGEQLATNLREVSDRLQRGAYQAPPGERVSMPKADGRQRPLGQPTLEDTSVQRATGEVLNAIYETAFLGFSYGARPGRSPHHALDAVTVGMEKRHLHGVRDADMRGCYDAIDHAWLGQLVAHRLGDPRVVRPIRKGLKAGGLEDGHWRPQEAGTLQGGSARPLLATLSLHSVCDLWAAQGRRRHARGDVILVRYGDDCIVGCQPKDAAEQLVSDLRERCHRFHLARHPDKTRLMALGRWASARRQRRGQGKPATCDCRGLPPRCGTTKRGKCTVRRCPSATRLRQKLQEVKQPLRERRHWPSEKLGAWLKRVVIGHDRYSGVPRNRGRRWVFRERLLRSWCHTRRRRSQRHRLPWQRRYRRATPWLPEPHMMPPYPAPRLRVTTQGRSPVRSCRTPGAVRGVPGNRHPYRDRQNMGGIMKRIVDERRIFPRGVVLLVALVAISVGLSASASLKPKPGTWSGSPQLSFQLTADGKIVNIISEGIPAGLLGEACRVCVPSCPVKNGKVNCRYGKMTTGEARTYLEGTFETETSFKGKAVSMFCRLGTCESGAGYVTASSYNEKALEAPWAAAK